MIKTERRIRSFVCRNRLTTAQRLALSNHWEQYGLTIETGYLQEETVFGRKAPCLLEIGFGCGQSFLAAALAHPDKNFIGVDVYQAGLGRLLHQLSQTDCKNVRLYAADVIDVLHYSLRPLSLDGVQIFFPDPWPKRRHHQRRLIQPPFIEALLQKLKPNATLHIATDSEEYAQHILATVAQYPLLMNVASNGFSLTRSPYRPIISKFEARSQQAGHVVREIQFVKQ